MSLVTLVKNAEITARNIANNLPTYVASPSPDVLRQRLAGDPAVLVAAGPSLSRNLDGLAAIADRVVIIAAQTTVKPLLDRGIRPHFVTTLDYSDLSRQFFETVDLPPDTVLVAEPKAAWQAVDAFRGTIGAGGRPVVMLDNDFAHLCLGHELARRARIEAGATVMHLAFYLAQWLGCDPIIFIGQDLGFSGHCYYCPGVAMHRAWQPELGRFGTLEQKEWERIARHLPILRKTVDVHGRDIYTDDQMFTYLQQFERDFAASAAQVIDATEGGVRKAGASVMTLREAAQRFCTRPLDANRLTVPRQPWYDMARWPQARAMLAARRRELDGFRAACEETRDILAELVGLIDDPPRFNRRIVRVDELRAVVQGHHEAFRMVSMVSQLGELQKFSADRRMAADAAGGPARTRQMLRRDSEFVSALLDGCATMTEILDQALARFDAAAEAGPCV